MNSLFKAGMHYTQDNRFLRIETGLGKDTLLLRRVQGSESLSELFCFELDLLSYDENINPADIVGDHVALSLDATSSAPRYLNGYVKSFVYTGLEKRGLYGYKAEIVPWLWFLDKRTNCRVYQNQNVQQIIESLLGELGFKDYVFSLSEEHPAMDYCVQYQESDFQFISRLMEQEGIFYFFEHQADKHILHIVDSAAAYETLSGETLEHSSGSRGKQYINAWQHRFHYCSGAFAQTDFNFENPNHSLLTETPTSVKLKNNAALELFDFPGNYRDTQQGQSLTRLRMQQEEMAYENIVARSNIHQLELGRKFKLRSDENAADNKKQFVITRIEHYGFDGSYLEEKDQDGAGSGSSYSNQFSCIPAAITFRPACRIKKPRIDGVQTAVVVGKAGDEIYTDKYGRIKLQFHWDRYGSKNEESSCWVRVATPWAGTKWGTLNIPRVGQEVVVTFVNGDPDQPLVIGGVYNGAHMPPVSLPEGKNYAGTKSRSAKGDSSSFNEMSIDDTKGSEQLKFHAQKDFNTTVGNNLSSAVTGNASYNVDGDSSSTVGGNATLTVQGNETSSVQGNQDASVQGNRSSTIAGNLTENTAGKVEASIGTSESRTVGTNQDLTVGTNQVMNVGANQTVGVGANQETSIGGNQTVNVSGNQNISALAQNVSISTNANTSALNINVQGQAQINLSVAGSSISIDASGITLAMGGSFVKIDAMGVSVMGPLVKLN